jgi:NAD(P)-dependent dehydrogenase (short-subunit alcohol dehydrogenase family)
MPSDNTTSPARRRLMQGAAARLMTSVAAHALGQASATEATGTAGAAGLADPRGLYHFTKSLAIQMVKRGIRVNAVAPGPFWTALQVSGGQTMENLTHFGEQVPLGRPGQPAEIAPLYVQLASTQASYVTGQVFGASGGAGQP